MTFAFSLQKILELKEHDKRVADEACTQATREFEVIATNLYHLLKQKEELQDAYETAMSKGISIHQIQLYHSSMEDVEKKIHVSQRDTQFARTKMHSTEHQLTQRALDVKKYEKVKEKRKADYDKWQKEKDQKTMDEMAVQSFSFK
ncbi:flagellar export protein FliJ [Alteribacter aurantiacus]|uniref:flagellar export protein FliJ n=1 Tax=Alteribacter aurantiacus TaxID=254410 RepID=UPI00040A143E|nr:flagellar export protein FliJ [Alteribacter aurantiacus]